MCTDTDFVVAVFSNPCPFPKSYVKYFGCSVFQKKNVKLDDDDLLGDIMAELKSEPSSVTMKPVPVKAKKLAPAK